MKQRFIFGIIIVLLLQAIITLLLLLSPAGDPPSPVGELWKQPLPTPAEIQEHINAVLQSHGEQGIEIDGAIGPTSRKSWDRALALQGGFFITQEAIERAGQ